MNEKDTWRLQKSRCIAAFLDWKPAVFHDLIYKANKFALAWKELEQANFPLIEPRWSRGSQQEWENIIKSFIVCHWSHFDAKIEIPCSISWQLQSASAMEKMLFQYTHSFPRQPAHGYEERVLPRILRRHLLYIRKQFHFVGQVQDPYGHCRPVAISGVVREPNHHEILEAKLHLRDWIIKRLPSEWVKTWLEFS